MSIYIPAETTARIQVELDERARRRSARATQRQQLAAARRIGLAYRHRDKLARQERITMPKQHAVEEPTPRSRTRRTTAVEQPAEPSVTDKHDHFRLADNYLHLAYRHLRMLKHLNGARDALKLVRQAQNLLMDAEDEVS